MEQIQLKEQLKALQDRKRRIAVVGLGYVGLPLAIAFARRYMVTGMDVNPEKIKKYSAGLDPTGEAGDQAVRDSHILFTGDPEYLREASLIIVAVPTPVNADKTPDLSPVVEASRLIGRNLCRGTVVVFESTVYPGVTETICAPAMEAESGLVCGRDFFIGYSPERVNPGDKVHTLETITKIISAAQPEVLDFLEAVYGSILKPTGGSGISPTFRASSIRVAEAAKLLENAQRDVNIAFMNEIALGLHRMGIDTADVIEAMNTKWNALRFYPGLVGGHCIGVDPYYFVYEMETLGFYSTLVSTARRTNDGVPAQVAHELVKEITRNGGNPSKSRVYMLGMTFKGGCPDLRNTKSGVMKEELESYGIRVEISDPLADVGELREAFGQEPVALEEIREADCLIFAADHACYSQLTAQSIRKMLRPGGSLLVADIRNLFTRRNIENAGCRYWNL